MAGLQNAYMEKFDVYLGKKFKLLYILYELKLTISDKRGNLSIYQADFVAIQTSYPSYKWYNILKM